MNFAESVRANSAFSHLDSNSSQPPSATFKKDFTSIFFLLFSAGVKAVYLIPFVLISVGCFQFAAALLPFIFIVEFNNNVDRANITRLELRKSKIGVFQKASLILLEYCFVWAIVTELMVIVTVNIYQENNIAGYCLFGCETNQLHPIYNYIIISSYIILVFAYALTKFLLTNFYEGLYSAPGKFVEHCNKAFWIMKLLVIAMTLISYVAFLVLFLKVKHVVCFPVELIFCIIYFTTLCGLRQQVTKNLLRVIKQQRQQQQEITNEVVLLIGSSIFAAELLFSVALIGIKFFLLSFDVGSYATEVLGIGLIVFAVVYILFEIFSIVFIET